MQDSLIGVTSGFVGSEHGQSGCRCSIFYALASRSLYEHIGGTSVRARSRSERKWCVFIFHSINTGIPSNCTNLLIAEQFFEGSGQCNMGIVPIMIGTDGGFQDVSLRLCLSARLISGIYINLAQQNFLLRKCVVETESNAYHNLLPVTDPLGFSQVSGIFLLSDLHLPNSPPSSLGSQSNDSCDNFDIKLHLESLTQIGPEGHIWIAKISNDLGLATLSLLMSGINMDVNAANSFTPPCGSNMYTSKLSFENPSRRLLKRRMCFFLETE
ncbi:hypothetical protein M433DRAFT_179408 [Acidomyces richmondensis BFW]|nr:MAG: hypothetical protein FE78DRAFT_296250 [Acidomyces sp. 'richmondensis']KYG50658.1 hypothetical protein M433DRAFT_179408 [Acidomyces richmondensis BFW]